MPPKNIGSPWTLEEEMRLYEESGKGMSTAEIAAAHGRTTGGITSRQKQMGLRNEEGQLISPLPEFRSYRRVKMGSGRETLSSPGVRRKRASSSTPHASGEERGANPTTVETIPWPENFPWKGSWIDQLWHALRYDIHASLIDRGQTEAPVEREVAIALARLTPANEFHPQATLAELGGKFGVTRERIRQIQTRVERRLAARVRQKSSLTARTLDKMTQMMPPDCREAPLSWFAGELSRQSDSKSFTKFMLTALLVGRGIRTKEARRRAEEATAIRPLRGTETSLSRQENKGDASPGDVERENAFVMRILKKAMWPKQLNNQLADLSEFPPLKECKYEQQYYSAAMKRYVGFDSWGEARLIRALETCTVVTERPIFAAVGGSSSCQRNGKAGNVRGGFR
jgi:hypothetical protein